MRYSTKFVITHSKNKCALKVLFAVAIFNTWILFRLTVLFVKCVYYGTCNLDLAEEKSAKVVKIQLVIMMKISRESRFQDGGKV